MRRIASSFFALSLLVGAAFAQVLKPLDRTRTKTFPGIGVYVPLLTQGYDRAEKELRPDEIAALNRPATALIRTQYDLEISYPIPGSFMLILLKQGMEQAISMGRIPDTGKARIHYLLEGIARTPGLYLIKTANTSSARFRTEKSGSGAFITPEGHIITNAHVVEVDKQQLQIQGASSVLQKLFEQQVGALVTEYGAVPDEAVQVQCAQAVFTYYAQFLRITSEQVQYFVQTGKSIDDPDYKLDAKLIAVGEGIPGKDIAILKVYGSQHPSIAFGDDRLIKPGNDVFVMGYPGPVSLHPILSQKMTEPTFTRGMMSARQVTKNGWTAL